MRRAKAAWQGDVASDVASGVATWRCADVAMWPRSDVRDVASWRRDGGKKRVESKQGSKEEENRKEQGSKNGSAEEERNKQVKQSWEREERT